jgi:flavin-dependent dehydrogenase
LTDWSPNKLLDTISSRFDVGIIGGGLAGLSLSILLAKNNFKVILFEKEKYPFHRVCGEYISLESWKFIEQELELNLSQLDLPTIKKLIVSSPNGNAIHAKLDLGGFGVSRFFIDNELKKVAVANGVSVLEATRINDVVFDNDLFTVKPGNVTINCNVVVGAFGKRSNLDVKWSRTFIKKRPGKLNNYLGVKYHLKTSLPPDTIALHNFKNGYCGISKVEGDAYCLCYLTAAQNLKDYGNSIQQMEQQVLFKNPFLQKIFTEAEFLFHEPVAISQISFDKKELINNHILMIGDAAGMITPLCGNGMSMALHSSKIAFEGIRLFAGKKISRAQMEDQYVRQWQRNFKHRLKTGRVIQGLFGREHLTNVFISMIKPFPFLINKIIKATHGREF